MPEAVDLRTRDIESLQRDKSPTYGIETPTGDD
jgi:hypothetical protein